MTPNTRTYSELMAIPDFEDRYRYLRLRGLVGDPTFGSERYVNQKFYRSQEWKDVRSFVIVRDNGLDLGHPDFEIAERPTIHHMNPMTVRQIRRGDHSILHPEYLITTTHQTHNAIHYGDENLLPRLPVERHPGDTKLW